MARFVFLQDWMGAPVAVNPEYVTEVHPRVQDSKSRVDILLVNSTPGDDQTMLTVSGDFYEIVRRLSDSPEARSIDTVHLTGWVFDPNHPESRRRLHPSILTDDQPPAWAPEKPTNGGAE